MSLFSRGNVSFSFSSLCAKLSVFLLLLLSPFFISQESIGIYALFNSWISLGVIVFYGPFEALIGREFVNFKNSESNSYYALKNYVNCVSVFLVAVTFIFYTFDVFLYEFFDIGEVNEGLITMALAYLGAYFLKDEITGFPNIFSNKFVKYPMFLSVIMMIFSTIKSFL